MTWLARFCEQQSFLFGCLNNLLIGSHCKILAVIVGETRLTCSTVNSSRANGGTSYYRIAGRKVRFLCRDIDNQIPDKLLRIQVDPELLPIIRDVYTSDVAEKMGHLCPNEKQELETALKAIDEEEARAVRLYASGKITEAIWDSLWREWQDKRHQIRYRIESLQERRETHIANLDSALEVISHVGIVYNTLSCDDQRELLRQMVEQVIIDLDGNVSLKLRTPFAYLQDISDEVRSYREEIEDAPRNTKTDITVGSSEPECSTQVLSCGEDRIRTCGPV